MPILGIDEVGRGPWAGPLVIGAVILEQPKVVSNVEKYKSAELAEIWDDLTDSKKLTKSRREELAVKIKACAFATGLGWVSAEELDELGLAESLRIATKRAVRSCLKDAKIENPEKYLDTQETITEGDFPIDEIIIDGTSNFLCGTALESIASVLPKGDLLIKEVSAASIIAKVARDNYMIETVAKKYPEYGFENHVGYGTKKHQAALEKYGPCPEHRTSVRPVARVLRLEVGKPKTKNTTEVGRMAEEIVAEYLRKKGHKIIARNYKTRLYEIDLVSATAEHLYFTEVKYRKNNNHGSPLEFIDKKKQRQMTFAAEVFVADLAERLGRDLESLPSPILAVAAVSGPNFQLEDWFPVV